MELYKEILMEVLSRQTVEVRFPGFALNAPELMEGVCCRALEQIRDIIRDDSLSDKDCFAQIEEIVTILEDLGSHGGNRHDFG